MSEQPIERTLKGAIFDLGGVMTEPLGRHRETIVDPVQLDLLRFFVNEFKDVYHLPTGAHDLHLLETGAISDAEYFDRMTSRYIEQGGHDAVDARLAEYVVFGHGMVACAAMIDTVRQVKGAGYRTALLTNISRSGEALWRSLLPVEELFDVVVELITGPAAQARPGDLPAHLRAPRRGAAGVPLRRRPALQCRGRDGARHDHHPVRRPCGHRRGGGRAAARSLRRGRARVRRRQRVTTPPVTVVDLSSPASGGSQLAAATHIGPVRKENQDAFGATPLLGQNGIALVVADGMGGLPGGGEAATAAVAAALAVLAAGSADAATVVSAVLAANGAVGELKAGIGGQPGTTLTIAAVSGQHAAIGHAGDSRAYLVSAGQARVLTSDHSWVGEQVRAGALPPGSERRHQRRNVITRAVMGDALEPEAVDVELATGDVLMLCSDGFWEPLSDPDIAVLLGTPGPLTAVVERAAEAALAAGATDNVTVVAFRLDS